MLFAVCGPGLAGTGRDWQCSRSVINTFLLQPGGQNWIKFTIVSWSHSAQSPFLYLHTSADLLVLTMTWSSSSVSSSTWFSPLYFNVKVKFMFPGVSDQVRLCEYWMILWWNTIVPSVVIPQVINYHHQWNEYLLCK